MQTTSGLWYDVTDLVAPWAEDGGPVLFHHGVGITSDVWLEWLPVLADRHRLVRLDMRGFGRSARQAPDGRWTMDRLVADALAVADAAGLGRFHLVGESIGGTLGLCLALRYPERLRSLTVCSTSHRGGSIQRVVEWRAFIERHGMAAWSAMMMDHRADPARVPEASRRWFERVQAESSAEATLGLADALIGTDLSAQLPAIRVPALILAPGASPFIPLEVALDLQARIPASEIRVFPGVRHAIVHSHGRACAEAVRDFLGRRGA
jgi:pimeloyl-ACP methyl ester carboxylesterase